MLVGITPLMFFLSGQLDQGMVTYIGINVFFILATLLPVFLVLYTVKQQTKVKAAQPPANLQLHEDQNKPPPSSTLQFHDENEPSSIHEENELHL